MRRGCCNASRGHYCTAAGRRNAAEEGGVVGAGPAQQAHQQVREKIPNLLLSFFRQRCVALGAVKGENWWQNCGPFSRVRCWISGVRWQWIDMVAVKGIINLLHFGLRQGRCYYFSYSWRRVHLWPQSCASLFAVRFKEEKASSETVS